MMYSRADENGAIEFVMLICNKPEHIMQICFCAWNGGKMEKTKTIFGYGLRETVYIEQPDAVVLYEDRDNHASSFTINPKIMSRHIMLLGGAGSGKTNVFNLTVEQLRDEDNNNANDVFIVFDTKGDFQKNFGKPGDIVLGNGKEYRKYSARWNIFDDVLADGDNPEDYELNAREMAVSLFSGRGSASQPFFSNAARDIFAHVIIYFIRRAKADPLKRGYLLNNKELVKFLLNADGKRYHKIFNFYSDMKGLLSYIGDGTSNQALGVFGELKSMLYDCFLGVFADDDTKGRFSMRKAVRDKGGRAVFVEYDLAVGEAMTPIYRLLIDLALKEALGRSEGEKGNVYMILDELKLLPRLQHLDDALNFGRSMGVKVIAGLQTINQLYDIYGREKGLVIAGGFATLFCFHTSDNASREYVTELFGENVVGYQYTGIDRLVEKREREGHTVETWDQLRLKQGQAVIGLADEESPFIFQFPAF